MTEEEADSKVAKAYNYGVVAGLELAKSIVQNTSDDWEPLSEVTEKLDDLLKAFLEGK